jgi:hypothetical protein
VDANEIVLEKQTILAIISASVYVGWTLLASRTGGHRVFPILTDTRQSGVSDHKSFRAALKRNANLQRAAFEALD